jgi:hypothetical protein
MTRSVVAALAAAAVLAGGAVLAGRAVAGLPALSDDFGTAALVGWSTMRGDDFGDGTDHEIGVHDGALTIVPVRSWWVDDKEAAYVWKQVAGDFVATMRVQVTGKTSDDPAANWSLSGILVRDPRSTHANENWVAFRTGFVNGSRVYERKTTLRSHSILVLGSSPSGWVDLRVARVGSRFFLLKRNAGGKWVEHWSYNRPDLAKTLQVGIDAFSGDESPHADLISRVDWFRFAPTGVPAKLRAAKDARLVPILAKA